MTPLAQRVPADRLVPVVRQFPEAAEARHAPGAPVGAKRGTPRAARRGGGGTRPAGEQRGTRGGGRKTGGGARPPSLLRQLTRIELDGGDGILVFAEGETLAVTSLDKVYFPEAGYTKGDVMRYYTRVAPVLLPAIADRPLTLKRYPNGIEGGSFFQQAAGEAVPEIVRVEQVMTEEEGMQPRFVGGDLATILYTVQLGTITVNAWHSRVSSLDAPDYAILDLDPGDDVPYRRVVEVAQYVKEELDRLGLHAIPKTSGASGLHVLVPLPRRSTYDTAAVIAEEVATRVAVAHPGVATVERSIASRPPGTVYVDHLQNARGKTLAAVLAVRTRPVAPVSTPLGWEQVGPRLDPQKLTIATVPRRLARLGERWTEGMREGNPAPVVRAAARARRTV